MKRVSIHISKQPSNNVKPLTESWIDLPDSHKTLHDDHLKCLHFQ